jgi:hypothetical protein
MDVPSGGLEDAIGAKKKKAKKRNCISLECNYILLCVVMRI